MKTLVITGGSRGIGRETARLFQDNGYAVINLSRSTPQLTNIAHIAVDLSSPESLERHQTELDQLLGDAGEITLIHNAGLMQKDSVRNVTTEALQRSLNVNLVSPSRINQLVLPHMKAGSSILYVGSTLSEKAVANTASYVAAKHGLIGLMRSTCQDLAGSGIHTACVCPGFTDTEMLRDHLGIASPENSEVIKMITSSVTAGRLIDPAEIAETLYFCATHPVINGSVIHANLGQVEH